MGKANRTLVVALALLVAVSAAAGAHEAQKSELPAYLLSWVFGFGSGHFYLGDDAAARHLVLDAVTLGASIAGTVVMYAWLVDPDGSSAAVPETFYIGASVALAGYLSYLGVRIWELVDLFRTVDQMKAEGKISVRPTVGVTQAAVAVGVCCWY